MIITRYKIILANITDNVIHYVEVFLNFKDLIFNNLIDKIYVILLIYYIFFKSLFWIILI